MTIKTVGVLGCGLMGAGIAQVSAAAGYKTIVREIDESLLKKGIGRIDKFLAGTYAGAYQDALLSEFDRYLPSEPPWTKA